MEILNISPDHESQITPAFYGGAFLTKLRCCDGWSELMIKFQLYISYIIYFSRRKRMLGINPDFP